MCFIYHQKIADNPLALSVQSIFVSDSTNSSYTGKTCVSMP